MCWPWEISIPAATGFTRHPPASTACKYKRANQRSSEGAGSVVRKDKDAVFVFGKRRHERWGGRHGPRGNRTKLQFAAGRSAIAQLAIAQLAIAQLAIAPSEGSGLPRKPLIHISRLALGPGPPAYKYKLLGSFVSPQAPAPFFCFSAYAREAEMTSRHRSRSLFLVFRLCQ